MSSDRYLFYAIYIWLLASLFYFYENSLTTALSVMTEEIAYTFKIGHFGLGLFSSAFFLAYATMQIPTGILLDHYPIRYIATFASFCCAIGCLILAFTNTLWIGLAGRFLMGFGSSFAALTTFKIASIWFDSRQFTTLSGLMLTFGNLGGVAGQMSVFLIDEVRWQSIIVSLGLIGLGITILNIFTIKDASSNHNKLTLECVVSDFRNILKQKNVWPMFIYGLLMYAPFLTLQSMFGKPFIQTTLHVNAKLSTQISAMMFYGFCVGAPIIGFISDRVGKRKPVILISSMMTTVCLTLTLLESFHYVNSFFVLFFLFGFFVSGFLPSFSIVKESVPPNRMGTALGLMNTFNTVGGIIIPPFIGYLLSTQNNQSNPFIIPLYILPLCTFFAILIAVYSDETYCKQVN